MTTRGGGACVGNRVEKVLSSPESRQVGSPEARGPNRRISGKEKKEKKETKRGLVVQTCQHKEQRLGNRRRCSHVMGGHRLHPATRSAAEKWGACLEEPSLRGRAECSATKTLLEKHHCCPLLYRGPARPPASVRPCSIFRDSSGRGRGRGSGRTKRGGNWQLATGNWQSKAGRTGSGVAELANRQIAKVNRQNAAEPEEGRKKDGEKRKKMRKK